MKWSFGAALGAGVALACTAPAFAAVDAFLQLDGVKGESQEKPGSIEITSWSFGAGRGISSPTGGASDRESRAPSVSEIHITKVNDKTSPTLMRACANGRHFASAILYVRKAGGSQPYLQYKLSDVILSSYSVSSGGDRPTESMTINFAKIEVQYQPQQSGQEPGGQHAMTPGAARLPPPGPGH